VRVSNGSEFRIIYQSQFCIHIRRLRDEIRNETDDGDIGADAGVSGMGTDGNANSGDGCTEGAGGGNAIEGRMSVLPEEGRRARDGLLPSENRARRSGDVLPRRQRRQRMHEDQQVREGGVVRGRQVLQSQRGEGMLRGVQQERADGDGVPARAQLSEQ
jgi:hypothetical protein